MSQNRWGNSARHELLIMALFTVSGFTIATSFALFDHFAAWTARHNHWLVDDFANFLVVLVFAAFIFGWRRWNELREEVGRRQKAEELLRKSESSFRQIVEEAGDLIYKTDSDGHFIFCNQVASKILQYSESELLEMNYLDIVKPDCRLEIESFYRKQMTNGIRETYKEFQIVAKDGTQLLIGQNVQLLIQGKRIVEFQAVARDITEHRRAEEKLRQMQEYQNLLRVANDAILVFDAEDGTILDVTGKACEMYGIALEDFIGRKLQDFTNDPVEAEERVRKVRTEGRLEPFETTHVRADGTLIRFLVSPSLVEYRNHKAILSIQRDITEQKRLEEKQASLQSDRDQLLEQLQLQMEFMPIAFILTDSNFQTTYWNPTATKIFGFTKEEVLGKFSHLLIVAEENQPFVETVFQRIATGEVLSAISENLTKDGRLINCDWHSAPLRRPDGTFVGIMSMAQDITERKQAELVKTKLEAQLRQAQKMEAIGTLAGGIAHDFNNMLAAIIGYGELALMDLPENSSAKDPLDQVLMAGSRAKELVQQILTFSRQEEHEREPLILQPIIDETLKLLGASLPRSIEIRQSIDPSVSPVLGNSTQLQQVFMNLFTNAWHAMSENGGVLEIGLTNVEVDIDFALANGLKQGPHVRVMVSDTGKGMDRPTLERIFEPFFTTKPPGSGTGLGLAVVHGTVKQLEGTISVNSEVGKGTTFNIYLPVHNGQSMLNLPAFKVAPKQRSASPLL